MRVLHKIRAHQGGLPCATKELDLYLYKVPGESLYLGALCHNRHHAQTPDGDVLDRSIRYRVNGTCTECALMATRKSRRPDDSSARIKLEDTVAARQLGMTLAEYYEAMGIHD